MSVGAIGLKAAWQGLNQVKGSEVRGPLVTHLEPSKEAKEAGGEALSLSAAGATEVKQGLSFDRRPFGISCFVFLLSQYRR